MRSSRRRRSNFNPFVSLTDILFNLILVLIFVSALFAQDVNQKYAENQDFQNRISNLQLERNSLVDSVNALTGDLGVAEEREAALRDTNSTLEEQIGILVNNLDGAQIRQQELLKQISVIITDLNASQEDNAFLQEKLTVVIGDLDIAETESKLLEQEITLVLGEADNLREQVSELSRNNFLVVELEWLTESHDLDLHVVDPQGQRFYWNQASYPDATSRLTLDNRIGARPNKPGLEIWTARDVQLGTYRIEVGLWACNRGRDGGSYQRCSTDGLANVLLRHRDGDDLIAEIKLPIDGSYAAVNGQDFSLDESLFNKLLLVAEVEVFEDNGELRLEVKPASGLTSTRLATTQQ